MAFVAYLFLFKTQHWFGSNIEVALPGIINIGNDFGISQKLGFRKIIVGKSHGMGGAIRLNDQGNVAPVTLKVTGGFTICFMGLKTTT